MNEWVEVADREYLSDFILAGGGSVKFLAGDVNRLAEASAELEAAAEPHGLVQVDLNAAKPGCTASTMSFSKSRVKLISPVWPGLSS